MLAAVRARVCTALRMSPIAGKLATGCSAMGRSPDLKFSNPLVRVILTIGQHD